MVIETTKRRLLGPLTRAVALACGLSAPGAAPAAAQWFGFNDGPMPPGAIVRALMQQGFAEIGRPRFNGRVYVVEGVNARGVPVRLVIDAYDGGVLSRTRLETSLLAPREVAPRGRFGPRFEEAEEFAPPRRIPGPDRYDPREVEPRRAERPEPRRVERPDALDGREGEPRRAERPDLRQPPNRAARNETPPLQDPPNQSPARAAAKPAVEPATPQVSVEGSAAAAKPADTPATTAAITPAPPAAKPEPAAPAAPAEPASAKSVEAAKPGAPEQPPAASPEPTKRAVRVIEGVTPVGPPAR
jgi:hypothetical protein